MDEAKEIETGSSAPVDAPRVGDLVDVFSTLDNMIKNGVVHEITTYGNQVILYDEEDKETLNMSDENWLHESSVHAEVIKTLPQSLVMSNLSFDK